MAGLVSKFNEVAARPPLWLRILVVPAFAFVVVGFAQKCGWAIGVIAAIVFGGIALPMALVPDATVAWSRRHPLLDGAVLGPVIFLALAYFTPWPLWVCVLLGLAGVALGAAGGTRRARHRARRG